MSGGKTEYEKTLRESTVPRTGVSTGLGGECEVTFLENGRKVREATVKAVSAERSLRRVVGDCSPPGPGVAFGCWPETPTLGGRD